MTFDGFWPSKPSGHFVMEMATQPSFPGEIDPEFVLGSNERTMVRLVASGVPDREIAQRLGLTESQVRDQLLVIFKKLAVAGLLDQLLYVGEEA
jgi:DNA-binding NarL/FixJ family response regulator